MFSLYLILSSTSYPASFTLYKSIHNLLLFFKNKEISHELNILRKIFDGYIWILHSLCNLFLSEFTYFLLFFTKLNMCLEGSLSSSHKYGQAKQLINLSITSLG